MDCKGCLVAVIGAGPAGLYSAQYLARQGVQVTLFNRDIKPGGLVEYGIFPEKHKMRKGLKVQFSRILSMPQITYLGNIRIGQSGALTLDDLRRAGYQAIMVTTGAQKNNWLGLPGETLKGVYHANDLVFHFNQLPTHAGFVPDIGRKVVVIGVGNVMLDIVHYLKLKGTAHDIIAFARRGPAEVKFDRQTLSPVASCLDMPAVRSVVDQVRPVVRRVGRDVSDFYQLLDDARLKADACDQRVHFRFGFLRSPRRLIGDDQSRLRAIDFEINDLDIEKGRVVSRGTGQIERFYADTVIFSIGSRVEENFGLPVSHGNYITTPTPRFPVDGISYEVYNPELCASCEDVFVSGWARKASEGIVGLARKDAERGARAVLQYLETCPADDGVDVQQALQQLPDLAHQAVNLQKLAVLEAVEQKIAAEKRLEAFKFSTDEEMLSVIDQFSES